MYTWSLYRLEDGLLTGHVIASDDPGHKDRNLTPGIGAVEGHHDHLSRRVNLTTGAVEDYQPPQPSSDHEWNPTTRRWQLSAEAQAKATSATLAKARHAELVAGQHDLVRRAVLGDAAARVALQGIEEEIEALMPV